MLEKRYTKLSTLLRDAISEALQVDQDLYRPDFSEWHTPRPAVEEPCGICFAGAVLAGKIPQTYRVLMLSDLTSRIDGQFSEQDIRHLRALDEIRVGELCLAWQQLHVPPLETTESQLAALKALEIKRSNPSENADTWLDFSQFINWDQFIAFLGHMQVLAKELDDIGM